MHDPKPPLTGEKAELVNGAQASELTDEQLAAATGGLVVVPPKTTVLIGTLVPTAGSGSGNVSGVTTAGGTGSAG